HERRVLWQLERQLAQNSRLAQLCTVQAAQLAVLVGTAEALAQSRALDQVLADVLATCLDMAGISKGALYLADSGGRLVLREQIGFAAEDRPRLERCFGQERLIEEQLRSGTALAIPSTAVEEEAGRRLLDELRLP